MQAPRKFTDPVFRLMIVAGLITLFLSGTAFVIAWHHEAARWTTLAALLVGCLWLALLLLSSRSSRQLEALLKQCAFLFHSLDHGIMIVNLEERIAFINDAFYLHLAIPGNSLLGEVFSEVAARRPDELIALAHRLLKQTRESGESQTKFLDLPLPDGGFQHIQITITTIKDPLQKAIGYLLHYYDRTMERELQESMRRNDQLETVSQMAASIAHEVRNPMTSVQGFLQLMSQEIDPLHAHSMYLHVMEEDLKRINSIITEYLNFSRMGNDSLEDVWVGTLLQNTYTLLQSEANLKGIELVLSSGQNPLLLANPNGLKQVLINLVRNGMEAMKDQGGGRLTLALETTPDCIVLLVKDSGPGIPPADLERIFKPFYTTKETGTGLGLHVCQKIIEEHHGTIRVHSEAGSGTVFSVYLPKNRLLPHE